MQHRIELISSLHNSRHISFSGRIVWHTYFHKKNPKVTAVLICVYGMAHNDAQPGRGWHKVNPVLTMAEAKRRIKRKILGKLCQ